MGETKNDAASNNMNLSQEGETENSQSDPQRRPVSGTQNTEHRIQNTEEKTGAAPDNTEALKKELAELNNKYLRLYADFENFKRLTSKNREELIKYSNEDLMQEILSVIDHLELALQHAEGSAASSALAEGVNMTLKELKGTLEKFGLSGIEASGKPFDPFVHHAMSQEESEESEENIVIKEFRKGYMYKDRVLRAALVGVSKKKVNSTG
ncbi:MAG: nucleotide exchange factor GrpE [Nitrospirae bacterium]|nr:nucleotide exchange factor GrpE [Nitrospirota bacterium]